MKVKKFNNANVSQIREVIKTYEFQYEFYFNPTSRKFIINHVLLGSFIFLVFIHV